MKFFAHRKKIIYCGVLFFFLLCGFLRADPYDDFVKKGRDHFGLFQYKDAKVSFEKAAALDPSRYDAHYNLGLTLRKLNDIQGALSSFEKALKAGPEELDCAKAVNAIYVQLAKEQRTAGNREQMMNYLQKACVAYPQNTQNWAGMLNELAADKKWNDIVAKGGIIRNANREALEAGDDRNLQKALIVIAKAYVELQDHAKARDFIKSASRIHNADEDLIRLQKELGDQATAVASSMGDEGRALLDKGDFKGAIEKLEKASGAEPANTELADLLELARKKLAVADFLKAGSEYEAKGKYAEALEKMEQALSRAEDDPEVKKRVASLSEYIEKTEKKRADDKRKKEKDALNKRMAEDAKRSKFKGLMESAKKNEQKGLYEFAIKDLEEALAVEKDDQIPADIERLKKLEQDAKQAHEQFLKDMAAVDQANTSGNFQKAYDILKKLSGDESLKDGEQVLTKLLDACVVLEKNDEIQKYSNRLSEIASGSLAVTYYKGLAAYLAGDYDTASPLLDKVNEKDRQFKPDLSKMIRGIRFNRWRGPLLIVGLILLYFIGTTLYKQIVKFGKGSMDSKIERMIKQGDYINVIPLIEKRLEDTEYVANRRPLMISLAEAYLRAGRFDEARAKGMEILAKDAKNVAAQRIIGDAYFQMKDTSPEGVEKIQSLFKIDETRKDVLAYLVAHYKAQQADSKTALDILHKQIALSPEDEDTLIFLAEYYCKRGTYNAQTSKVFERATRVDPDRPEFLNGHAQCLLQTGKKEEAGKLMLQGRERWPGHELFRGQGGGGLKTTVGMKATGDGKQASSASVGKMDTSGSVKAGPSRVLPTASIPHGSGKAPPKPSADAAPAGDTIKCNSCQAMNSGREYYCTKCGKPLK